ncbi:MAG: PaaI family thioesterase [Pyrinomonadaceae bacterium]|nr:PaaI family thioesterase [Pyrinomonadaceae bacterium]
MIKPAQKKLAHEIFKTIPYINLIGMELVDIDPPEATVKLEMRDQLRQPHGLLHGGATASLIDTATAFALISVVGEEKKFATVDLNVHYLRPHTEGVITCTAKVVKPGRRLSTISADVINEEGKLIATALSTYVKVG